MVKPRASESPAALTASAPPPPVTEDAPLIVSISGIRGIAGKSLTNETIHNFSAAFASWLPPQSGVVLARDTRPSGAEFAATAAAAITACGCDLFDLGIAATPAAKLMVAELGAAGALILTASHNPAEWNGLKLVRADGVFLNADQGGQVEAIYRGGRFRSPDSVGTVKSVQRTDVHRAHLERLLRDVDVDRIRNAGLKVAVDPCNGTGGLLLPELLSELGVEAVFINADPSGDFAHEPEPIPDNLRQLGEAVVTNGCAVGFAIDPDADRVALVAEDGQPVGEDYTLALAVSAVTARRRGPVVTTLSTSQIVSDAAAANDCPVLLTPVGEVHVVEKMMAADAVIGGEGNGGVILVDIDPGRDAAVGILLLLEALAASSPAQALSALVARLPRYFIEKRKVTCTTDQLQSAVTAIQKSYPDAYTHPVNDGVKLYFSGQLECPWVHLRASNTEPVVRIIAESRSADEVVAMCDEVEAELVGRT